MVFLIYFRRQEAIQAALCEKDANIALLEMSSTKKQKNADEICRLNQQKEKLNKQLKELVRWRQDVMVTNFGLYRPMNKLLS